MIVVADTSPINYLLLIQEIDILPKMYGNVVIPRAVYEELLRPVAPEIVRAWISRVPAWLEIRIPNNRARLFTGEAGPRRARCDYACDRTPR